tara:strand:- start:8142 stop:9413 length:1272 start_codon:yes stop_codon:yes gene_type:complete
MGNLNDRKLNNLIKRALNEAPIDYEGPERMDPSIERKILDKSTPYSKHPAMPKMSRDFVELISSKRFNDTVTKLRSALERTVGSTRHLTSGNPLMNLMMLVMQALRQSSVIESRNKEELENLAVELVKKEMAIPPGSLQFDAKLVSMGQSESNQNMRRQPEEPSREEMMDAFKNAEQHENDVEAFLDAMDAFDREKAKRRLINSLIGGAAKKGQYMYHMVSQKLNEIDPDLIELYGISTAIIDHLYWLYPEETLQAMSGQEGSEVGTSEIDKDTDPPTVKARGANFPTLVHELVKGVYEVFGTHGLPDDPKQAEMVMAAEDTVPAEAWDLKLGPVFWELLQKSYPIEILTQDDMKHIQHYLFMRLSAMPAEDFFELFREVLEEKPSGKQKIQRMVNEIVRELEENNDEEDDEEDDDILSQLGL